MLETHLKPDNISKVCGNVFGKWNWQSNVNVSPNSCRIALGWNSNVVNLMVIHSTRQVILCLIESLDKKVKTYCTFIYASNSGKERHNLLHDLRSQAVITKGHPWVLLGDFNTTRRVNEYSSGCSTTSEDMKEFNDCIFDVEIEDVGSTGFHFTWTNSLKNPQCVILKKLDRIMSNEEFLANYPQAFGTFLPYLVSDHSPTILTMPNGLLTKKKSLRIMNHIASKVEFLKIVEQGWVKELRTNQKKCQEKVDKNPHDLSLRVKAASSLLQYQDAKQDELTLLKQKAKIYCLADGDKNTKFFQSVLKSRKQKSKVDSICDDNGVRYFGEQVADQFVDYFHKFLGENSICRDIEELGDIFTNKLSNEEANAMVTRVSDSEIKTAIFDIDDDKVSGPDGYSSLFFKKAWSIIGFDICEAVKEFFNNGCLLKEVNATLISIIPKIDTPNKVSDFRPFA
ncbi:uncharacterized protein [Rutidosis leptorrhynchoides]|uniref:uncharacterized protein n=1 Tax=Rutidosis leptorrhynchoides TaxID=125765 RepID=UPI003A9A1D75